MMMSDSRFDWDDVIGFISPNPLSFAHHIAYVTLVLFLSGGNFYQESIKSAKYISKVLMLCLVVGFLMVSRIN